MERMNIFLSKANVIYPMKNISCKKRVESINEYTAWQVYIRLNPDGG